MTDQDDDIVMPQGLLTPNPKTPVGRLITTLQNTFGLESIID